MSGKNEKITMLHGAGGSVMHNLVKNYIVKYFGGLGNDAEVPLEAMDDAAVIGDVVFKSDSHAVKPIFFPGGDIGLLSISGTVNDIAAMGAMPYALACGFILEEGLLISDLERILVSMRETCIEAGVSIVTGDTKVVEKGSLGGLVMNVSGLGKRTARRECNDGESHDRSFQQAGLSHRRSFSDGPQQTGRWQGTLLAGSVPPPIDTPCNVRRKRDSSRED